MSDYTDPISRYKELLSSVPPSTPNAELSAPALQQVIDDAKSASLDPREKLAEHIALNSGLSKKSATAVVDRASPSGTPDATKVSSAASAAAAISADVELSDPVMLWPAARCVFASVLIVILGGVAGLCYQLANGSPANPVSAWAYATLAVTGAVSFIGALVLIMGYKNVTIKGNSGPSSS
jgi:hypothetical protein